MIIKKLMKKVALIGEVHEEGLKILKDNNFSLINVNDYSENNLTKTLKDVDAIALRTAELNETVLQNCHSLKIVSRHGVGYDNVDLNYLNKEKIALAITGSANAITVAEHVMSMFLYLCKLTNISDQLVKDGKFNHRKSMQDTIELYKKNIFIIGFGRIGKALAKRCQGFEANVYIFDPLVHPDIIEQHECKTVKLDEGLQLADFISIHSPLNKNTKHLIAKNELSKMKKTCVLVNTSRGGIIKENDLIWALNNNIIKSAGLDVFEKEPPDPNNPLFKLENVVLSPHNAALTIECTRRMGIETCKNIADYLNKSPNLVLKNLVNKDILNLN